MFQGFGGRKRFQGAKSSVFKWKTGKSIACLSNTRITDGNLVVVEFLNDVKSLILHGKVHIAIKDIWKGK